MPTARQSQGMSAFLQGCCCCSSFGVRSFCSVPTWLFIAEALQLWQDKEAELS